MAGKAGREPKQSAKQELRTRKSATSATARSEAASTREAIERSTNPASSTPDTSRSTRRSARPTAKSNVRITPSPTGGIIEPVGAPSESDLAAYVQEVRTALEETVVQGIVRRAQRGAALIPAKELARRMLAVAPAPAPRSRMAEQVGPDFYDTNGVATVLSANRMTPVSKQAIEARRNRQTILALQTQDGRWIYPTWQFQDGDVASALVKVLHAFRDSATAVEAQRALGALSENSTTTSEPTAPAFSTWSVATWLTTARSELAGRTYAEVLLKGTDASAVDAVVARARHTAATWAA